MLHVESVDASNLSMSLSFYHQFADCNSSSCQGPPQKIERWIHQLLMRNFPPSCFQSSFKVTNHGRVCVQKHLLQLRFVFCAFESASLEVCCFWWISQTHLGLELPEARKSRQQATSTPWTWEKIEGPYKILGQCHVWHLPSQLKNKYMTPNWKLRRCRRYGLPGTCDQLSRWTLKPWVHQIWWITGRAIIPPPALEYRFCMAWLFKMTCGKCSFPAMSFWNRIQTKRDRKSNVDWFIHTNEQIW